MLASHLWVQKSSRQLTQVIGCSQEDVRHVEASVGPQAEPGRVGGAIEELTRIFRTPKVVESPHGVLATVSTLSFR